MFFFFFFFFFFLFLRLSYNSIIYPFPFLPASPPLYFSMYSFKPTASFSFTNGYCLHICLYLSVPRYNLLNLYSVTCVYVFISVSGLTIWYLITKIFQNCFILYLVCWCFAYVYVSVSSTCLVLVDAKKGITSFGPGIIAVICHVGTRNQTQVLWKSSQWF